ncbi:MAG: GNAT family N-acetyltransferase [Bacteroidales bacterium]
MEISKAQKHQLLEILYIIKECSRQLLEKGVKYWNNSLADFNDIALDIEKGFVYIIFENRVPVGTITLKPDDVSKKSLSIGRLAIYPAFQKKGLAHQLLTFALNFAKEEKYKMVSGYIPVDDKSLVTLLEENGFENKGIAPPPKEEFVKIIFEKTL